MEKIRQIFEREFKQINGLYHPSDDLFVYRSLIGINCGYRSRRFSPEGLIEERDDTYDNSTKIDFTTSLERGIINWVSVRRDLRKKKLARAMVELAEKIIKEIGARIVEIEWVDNKHFWNHMGYSPVVGNEDVFRKSLD